MAGEDRARQPKAHMAADGQARAAFDRSQSAPRGGSFGMVLLIALLAGGGGRRPRLCRARAFRDIYPGAAGGPRHHRRVRAVCAGRRHPAVFRPGSGQYGAQGGGRQRLRRRGRHRPGRPRVLRQYHLSRSDWRYRRRGRAADRARVHGRCGDFGSDLPAVESRARGQALAGRSAHPGTRARALAAHARAPARRRQGRQAHGLVDRRRDARPRAPGERVPGAAARHRLSRSRPGRLLLGRCRRRRRLSQRHALGLARSRSRPGRRGLAQAHRNRGGRGRRAVDHARRRARRGEDRGARPRPEDARRQAGAGAAVSQGGVRRRRHGRSLAHFGAQSGARCRRRFSARGGSALHALLPEYADGDCDRRQIRPHRAQQCALRHRLRGPAQGRRPLDLRGGGRARQARAGTGDRQGGGRAGRHRAGGSGAGGARRALRQFLRPGRRGGGQRRRSGHRLRARDHGAAYAGKPRAAAAEDGIGRPARRRHRPRLQQRALGHHDGHRFPAQRAQADRSFVQGHHPDQAERQPRRRAGAPAVGVLAQADACGRRCSTCARRSTTSACCSSA